MSADGLVLLVTWANTYRTVRIAWRNNIRSPLGATLLRDGTLYFVLLLMLNVITIMRNITSIFAFTLSGFSTPYFSMAISHFLLNLRRVASNPPALDPILESSISSRSPGQRTSLRFRSFVDNIGEDLNHDSELPELDVASQDERKDTISARDKVCYDSVTGPGASGTKNTDVELAIKQDTFAETICP
ncbi:hypothetical protein OBBRIDRAFT_526138 [Obba rivulosa]|uniref:Uncharacterized protein n=1 Tax=Obba rivulosa TaxID=1052685 RepID=A0A8E2AUW5_9APHY|nr:hypothetical protein OBBRIDRAFT_526138 [Obba rivulosa]